MAKKRTTRKRPDIEPSPRGIRRNGTLGPSAQEERLFVMIPTSAKEALVKLSQETGFSRSQCVSYLLLREIANHNAGEGVLEEVAQRMLEVI